MIIYECNFICAFIGSEPVSFTLQEEHTKYIHIYGAREPRLRIFGTKKEVEEKPAQ